MFYLYPGRIEYVDIAPQMIINYSIRLQHFDFKTWIKTQTYRRAFKVASKFQVFFILQDDNNFKMLTFSIWIFQCYTLPVQCNLINGLVARAERFYDVTLRSWHNYCKMHLHYKFKYIVTWFWMVFSVLCEYHYTDVMKNVVQ